MRPTASPILMAFCPVPIGSQAAAALALSRMFKIAQDCLEDILKTLLYPLHFSNPKTDIHIKRF